MRSPLQLFRRLTLPLVLLGGVYLLLPEFAGKEENSQPAHGGMQVSAQTDKKVIRFSPGLAYLPGRVPFGMGERVRGLQDVIDDFQTLYPEWEIEIQNVPSALREYLVTQLSSGRAPDIINVNVEDVWVDVQKGWYVPLDSFLERPHYFVKKQGDPNAPGYEEWWDLFKYQAISRGKAAPDGYTYAISYDMVETGIYYNKDAFRQAGVDRPPKTWSEWLEDMAKLREAGFTPLALNISNFNDWATDILFDQFYYTVLPGIDIVQNPIREPYLEGYLDTDEISFLFRKGFFHPEDPRYAEVWRYMRDLRGYAVRNLVTSDLIREFVTQRSAMLWGASDFTYRLVADPELGFDWGVFYLPPITRESSPWASGTEPCVIGGPGTQLEITNSALRDTDPSLPMAERMKRSERLKMVIRLLQFLTLPENYERIVNEYPSYLPNIVGVPVLPELKPIEDILDRRYTTTKWVFTFDLRFNEMQQRLLEVYLEDQMPLEEFLQWQMENIDVAVKNHRRRKETMDWAAMEAQWTALAPVRDRFQGMPNE